MTPDEFVARRRATPYIGYSLHTQSPDCARITTGADVPLRNER